tara:strand:+ start:75 stop:347 length:273 start_codon:yes stop_codon:yes gene_type:complete
MTTTKQVKQLLKENPEMRDNPKKLLRKAMQKIYGVNMLSAMIIAEHYKEIERVMRSSRKLQQDYKELRGKEWKRRKTVLEPIARANLGYK